MYAVQKLDYMCWSIIKNTQEVRKRESGRNDKAYQVNVLNSHTLKNFVLSSQIKYLYDTFL